ncbi:hypothetical protein FB595_1871, partial [Sphingobium sp. AEW010]
HSGDDNTRTLIAHRASAYYSLGTTFINAPIISRMVGYAAGGLYSTVGDLLLWDRAGILPCAEVTVIVNPAWKHIIIDRAASPLKPRQQAGPGIGEKFELNRSTRFLLHDYCACSDLPSADDIANFHANKVATAQLAVNRKV